jgi:prepilin-type N-terminal cleavage/methylation domain-containing protein
MNASRQGRAGFTVIELLVVIMIIGTLVALLLPAVQAAREAARRSACSNNLHQIGLALHNYHATYNILPPGSIVAASSPLRQNGWGWGAQILPYLEQTPLFNTVNMMWCTTDSANLTALGQSLAAFSCPSDPAPSTVPVGSLTLATGNYAGSAGSRAFGTPGVLYEMSIVDFGKITDGLSLTFLVGERLNQSVPNIGNITSGWYGELCSQSGSLPNSIASIDVIGFVPINMARNLPGCFSSLHPQGAQFLCCDGSAHFVSQTVNVNVYQAIGTRSGGEVIDPGVLR